MKMRLIGTLTVLAACSFAGCSEGGGGATMNPGTVQQGADAAKIGLQGTTDMKSTMKKSAGASAAPPAPVAPK